MRFVTRQAKRRSFHEKKIELYVTKNLVRKRGSLLFLLTDRQTVTRQQKLQIYMVEKKGEISSSSIARSWCSRLMTFTKLMDRLICNNRLMHIAGQLRNRV